MLKENTIETRLPNIKRSQLFVRKNARKWLFTEKELSWCFCTRLFSCFPPDCFDHRLDHRLALSLARVSQLSGYVATHVDAFVQPEVSHPKKFLCGMLISTTDRG